MGNAKAETAGQKASILIEGIRDNYETNLNNNLDFKSAFTKIFDIISRLDKLRRQNQLSHEQAQSALESLKRIDATFQVIF